MRQEYSIPIRAFSYSSPPFVCPDVLKFRENLIFFLPFFPCFILLFALSLLLSTSSSAPFKYIGALKYTRRLNYEG